MRLDVSKILTHALPYMILSCNMGEMWHKKFIKNRPLNDAAMTRNAVGYYEVDRIFYTIYN